MAVAPRGAPSRTVVHPPPSEQYDTTRLAESILQLKRRLARLIDARGPLFLEGSLVELAQCGVGQFIAKLDYGRHLMASETRLQPFKQRRFVDRYPALHCDDGFQPLPEFAVGDADNTTRVDIRMLSENILQLDRVNVLPSGDDHVIDSTTQKQITVCIAIRDVARLNPTLPTGCPGAANA